MKKKVVKQVKRTDPKRPGYRLVVFSAFFIALIVDQITKYMAGMDGNVVVNKGISFGLLSGPWLTVFLLIFFLMFFEWSCPRWHKLYPVATGLLLGGALSNIVDRIVLNGVRDFLPVPFFMLQNNVADWLIVISLAYILFRSMDKKSKTS